MWTVFLQYEAEQRFTEILIVNKSVLHEEFVGWNDKEVKLLVDVF